ncbi:MAG TPA: histidine phosphatase family protein [Isosphaeraceae bacterium]|nr:histidine phosphatase family protein [Isosphaeraceae bacterium]
MTTLLLIRHGIAEDPRPGQPDSERALTEEGWAKTRAAMKGLVAKGFVPARAISSPYRRALETMACLKEAAGTAFPVGYSELFTPEEDPADTEAWLRTLMRGAGEDEVIAFTSHQPLLGDLIARMTGQYLDIKKAGCTVIDWTGADWRFRKHFAPSELRGA